MLKRARGGHGNVAVYICEYHDEALRCLHHGIRRKRIPFTDLTMVHLDAHPDLSASSTLAAETVLESPHDLYHALRVDTGGIAQWILPAVYGGHFHCVWWVRPSWAHQIQDGDYDVLVGRAKHAAATTGAANGDDKPLVETIHISCSQPYFVEDGIYCPETQLTSAKPLRLMVSELPTCERLPFLGTVGTERDQRVAGAWTLDVCLDFFACGNPFLKHVRPSIAAPFAAVQNAAQFRQGSVSDARAFLATREAFEKAYNVLLQQGASGVDSVESLGAFLPEAARAKLLSDVHAALGDARALEVQELLEAGDMVTLPVHPTQEAELQERLSAFEDFVQRLCADSALGSKPAAVTIARSVVDGFCPMRWHSLLECGVLKVLGRLFGELDVLYSDELDSLDNL